MRFTAKGAVEVALKILIAGALIVLITFAAYGLFRNKVSEPRETTAIQQQQAQANSESELWKEAERNNQPNSLNIEFNEITTEPHWYALMSTYTNIFANKLEASGNNPNVIVAPEIIPKDTYMDVDGNLLDNIEYGDTTSSAKPDSSIYFQGAYLGKYLSESGHMESIIASMSDSGITVGAEGNQVMFNYTEESQPNTPKPTTTPDTSGISEEDYLNTLKEFINYIYAPTSGSDIDKAREIANNYFTSECANDVISDTNKYNPDSQNSLEILTIMAGKSDLTLESKDRVYVSFRLLNETDTYTLSLEMKLNNQQKVFDIDLI